MARIRSIKPTFWSSEPICALSRDARLLFIGMWNYADDFGRGVDNPRLICNDVFPLDEDMDPSVVDALMDELVSHDRIVRYIVNGRRYFAVLRWDEHQRVSHATESQIPEPSDTPPDPFANPPESFASPPESFVPDWLGEEGIGGEGKAIEPCEREPLLNAAAKLITKRRGITDRGGAYVNAAIKGIRSDYQDQAYKLMLVRSWTPDELADELEPPPKPKETLREVDGVLCRHVSGSGWVPIEVKDNGAADMDGNVSQIHLLREERKKAARDVG